MLKNRLIKDWTSCFPDKKTEATNIERKILALTMLLISVCATIIGGFILTAHATDTNSTTPSATSSPNAITSDTNTTNPQPWGMNGMNTFGQGFGGSMGPGGNMGGFMGGPMTPRDNSAGCMGGSGIEISPDYIANVTAVLDNDTNVQNLISEGYNVTSINPIIQSVINGDGTITMQANTAVAKLQDGTSGYAIAHVDLNSGKVTQLVIITRTVIDNTTANSTTNSTSTSSS